MSFVSYCYTGLPRAVSLLLALGVSGVMFAFPQALQNAGHGVLSLLMLGVCAGFVHGVGFIPEHGFWRGLFGPWVAWPIMGLALWMLRMVFN